MSQSPTRTRSRTSALDVEAVVEAVVTRLTSAGLIGATPAAAASQPVPETGERKPVFAVEVTAPGPCLTQQRLWLEELRAQHGSSVRFGTREKEEVRALLIIGDTGGPPGDHHAWYWSRVRLLLIVAHHGWAAAIDDSHTSEMDRLGIHLAPAAARPAVAPTQHVAASDVGRRARPSLSSGFRPPRRTAPAASTRRQD